MCCFLVSGFLTEITQQIHSLRASGVMSSHAARAAESEVRALRKSGGTLCRAPPEIPFLAIEGILPIMSHRLRITALAFGSAANSCLLMTSNRN